MRGIFKLYMNKKHFMSWKNKQTFSIRKYSVGTLSILLGVFLFGTDAKASEDLSESFTSDEVVSSIDNKEIKKSDIEPLNSTEKPFLENKESLTSEIPNNAMERPKNEGQMIPTGLNATTFRSSTGGTVDTLPEGRDTANPLVDLSKYEVVWDETIELNGQPVGPLPGRTNDVGFKKMSTNPLIGTGRDQTRNNSAGYYQYYFDFADPFTLDYGEIMKRIKIVPKAEFSDLPTYYGRDWYVIPTGEAGGGTSGSRELKYNEKYIDIAYISTQGFTNRKNNSIVGSGARFTTVTTVTTEDGTIVKEVGGARYDGIIAVRPYTMTSARAPEALSFNFTLQGVDMRAPEINEETTKNDLKLNEAHTATRDSLETQFTNDKVTASDNVTTLNKLRENVTFTFSEGGQNYTLEQVMNRAETSNNVYQYTVKVTVKDQAGQEGETDGNNHLDEYTLPNLLTVVPDLKAAQNDSQKAIISSTDAPTEEDKAKIIAQLKANNSGNTALQNLPTTAFAIDGNDVRVTYQNGDNTAIIPVTSIAGTLPNIDAVADARIAQIRQQQNVFPEDINDAVAEIEKIRSEAKKALNSASNLGAANEAFEEKKASILAVSAATNRQPAITEVTESATNKINAINQRNDLTTEEKEVAIQSVNTAKETAIEAINNATNRTDMNNAKTTGKNAIAAINPTAAKKPAANTAIDEAAARANEAIDNNAALTAEEKAKAKEAVAAEVTKAKAAVTAATTNAEVDAAVASFISIVNNYNDSETEKISNINYNVSKTKLNRVLSKTGDKVDASQVVGIGILGLLAVLARRRKNK